MKNASEPIAHPNKNLIEALVVSEEFVVSGKGIWNVNTHEKNVTSDDCHKITLSNAKTNKKVINNHHLPISYSYHRFLFSFLYNKFF